jgi:hypothetical protein
MKLHAALGVSATPKRLRIPSFPVAQDSCACRQRGGKNLLRVERFLCPYGNDGFAEYLLEVGTEDDSITRLARPQMLQRIVDL